LEKLWNSNADDRMRARALWALIKIPGAPYKKYIDQGVLDKNPDLRITSLRAATELNADVVNVIKALSNDKDDQVKRACIIALHHLHSPESAKLWASLASQYAGNDRWYLEALGIGADQQWDSFFSEWLNQVNDPLQTAASRDIVWRSRTGKALPFLAQLAIDSRVSLKERIRYFRAFDFNNGDQKSALLLEMIARNGPGDTAMNKLVLHHLDVATVRKSPIAQNALKSVLLSVDGTPEYIELVDRYGLRSENKRLLQLAIAHSGKSLGVSAARTLLKQDGHQLAWNILNGSDTSRANKLIIAISRVGSAESIDMVQKIALSSSYPEVMRETAAANIGRSGSGEDRVLELLRHKKVPATLIPAMVASVNDAWRKAVRDEAARYLPGASPTAIARAPTMEIIKALTPNAIAGRKIYSKICSVCHVVNKEGNDFGPPLSEIGSKYPKEGLLTSIVHPSEGIGFGYEGWNIELNDGSSTTGIISSKTSEEIELKLPGGTRRTIKQSEIKSRKELDVSLMPEGLYQGISTQDMADLLEYLSSLKKR
jgi:putative heme-binding domain-containing protein